MKRGVLSILILVGTVANYVSCQNFFGDMPSDYQASSDEVMLDSYLKSHIFFCFDMNHDGLLT